MNQNEPNNVPNNEAAPTADPNATATAAPENKEEILKNSADVVDGQIRLPKVVK